MLAAALSIPAATQADDKAATPEKLVELMQVTLKKDDPKAYLHLLGGPHRTLNEQAIEAVETAKAFDKALDDKFGKDPSYRSCFALEFKPVKRVDSKNSPSGVGISARSLISLLPPVARAQPLVCPIVPTDWAGHRRWWRFRCGRTTSSNDAAAPR